MKQHSEREHALLSPSSSARWLACPPSARLEVTREDEESVYALEGTMAHELAEASVRNRIIKDLSYAGLDDVVEAQRRKAGKSGFDFKEMLYCAKYYEGYIDEKAKPGDFISAEEKLDFSEFIPEGFGTCDCIICNEETLTIIDYKYGKNVVVSAEKNPQLMIYALGALKEYKFAYSPKKVQMCIFQPRVDHISEYTMTARELETWANEVLKPTAELAFAGAGKAEAGTHCKFCKVAGECDALYEQAMAECSKDFDDDREPIEQSNERLSEALKNLDFVEIWISATKKKALNKALAGEKISDFKLVEGRSNRKYKDEAEVRKRLKSLGYKPSEINKPTALKGLTEIKKVIKKEEFTDIVEPLLIKPPGAPTLVPESDKRPELNLSILDEFEEEK